MTRQVGDNLILNGEQYELLGSEELPENDERIVDKKIDNINTKAKKNNLSHFDITKSTACYRGYIAIWEVKDDVLYLNSVKGCYRLLGDLPIIAEWYTDTLKIPMGNKLHHDIGTPLADIYESEIHLKIENGRVMSSEIIDRREEYDSTYGTVENMSRKEAIRTVRQFLELDDDKY